MTHDVPSYRILIVDDQLEMALDVRRELLDTLGRSIHFDLTLETENDFEAAERRLVHDEFDVVVLDVRRERTESLVENRHRGAAAFEVVRNSRFLPVVFYTALPEQVEHLAAPPLISVVPKDQLERVPIAVRAALDSGVPLMTRTLHRHVEGVLRGYLWDQVAPNWNAYTSDDPVQMAQMLVARVTHSIRERGMADLVEELMASAFSATSEVQQEGAAATYYIYPPVTDTLKTGTLLRRPSPGQLEPPRVVDGNDKPDLDVDWWVVLTPACDLEQGNAEFVLLARGIPLVKFGPFLEWKKEHSNSKWQRLEPIVREAKARYAFLPAFQEIPDLIIDLEQVRSEALADMVPYIAVATLDSPYVEALLARHGHFRGRIGTPDLDPTALKTRLQELSGPWELPNDSAER